MNSLLIFGSLSEFIMLSLYLPCLLKKAMWLDRETETEEAPIPPTSDKEETPFFDGLIVRIENGHVGVYTKGGELLRVLDIDPSALPKKDRDLLETGIEIGSWKELLALIRDYVG